MTYRIDDLAAATGLTVDTVRYYQSEGLLPPPQREGRVARYDEGHRERLERIRSLKAEGLRLATIRRVLDEDPADAALVRAVSGPLAGDAAGTLSPRELAERAGVPESLLDVLAREGFLVPSDVDGQARYSISDAEALRAGLALLEAGVPLDELLGLARRHDATMRAVAADAVDLFVRFVRDPIQGAASSEEEAGRQLVSAFEDMLPAAGSVVAHHFRRLLLEVAEARAAAEAPLP